MDGGKIWVDVHNVNYGKTAAGGPNILHGGAGNDTLDLSEFGGGAYGGVGNDVFYGGGAGSKQSHMYGGVGNDTFYLDTSDRGAPYADHVWGGRGADTFIFNIDPRHSERITGRLDDFDPTRDIIQINGAVLDFENLPQNVRIVQHNGQPWLLIDGRVLFALEGAREYASAEDPDIDGDKLAILRGNANDEELHFIDWPATWANGVPAEADIPYVDFVSFFPSDELIKPQGGFNIIAGRDQADQLSGTAGADSIWGGDGSDKIYGGAGHDVIDGGERHDTIYGGAGNDSIAGGLDNDLIYGGLGDDVIYGGSGQDTLYGDEGNDRVSGNNGRDLIYGGAGDDTLSGGWGRDTLYGGDGDDRLYASIPREEGVLNYGEHDVLYGGRGHDTLYAAENGWTEAHGGPGMDRFVAARAGLLTVQDFLPSIDTLDLSGLVSKGEDLAKVIAAGRPAEGQANDLTLSLASGTSVVLEGLGKVDTQQLLASIVRGADYVDDGTYFPTHNWEEEEEDEDPHAPKDEEPEDEVAKADGTCFVATAAYGDGAHPDVVWLRYLRDEHLVHSAAGRAFVATYWKVGPILARFVKADHWTGRVSRGMLGWFVARMRPRIR